MIEKLRKIDLSIPNLLFLAIFFSSFTLSLIIFLSLSGNLSNLEQIEEVSGLISTNYVLILALIIISITCL